MKHTAGLGVLFAVAFILTLELAGAGASLAAGRPAPDASDCFGYSVCQ